MDFHDVPIGKALVNSFGLPPDLTADRLLEPGSHCLLSWAPGQRLLTEVAVECGPADDSKALPHRVCSAWLYGADKRGFKYVLLCGAFETTWGWRWMDLVSAFPSPDSPLELWVQVAIPLRVVASVWMSRPA